MNKVELIGRLTNDPEIHLSHSEDPITIAKFDLAVDRGYKRGGQTADFIPCISLGRTADFVEKWLHKGDKIAICGRIQQGSYKNRNGRKINTITVLAEDLYFCERRRVKEEAAEPQEDAMPEPEPEPEPVVVVDEFADMPKFDDDEDLPFN